MEFSMDVPQTRIELPYSRSVKTLLGLNLKECK
jgi:hypothetical protein